MNPRTRLVMALALALPATALWFGGAGAQAQKYQVSKPAQAGSIAGKVTLEGNPPAPKKFLINKNKEVCGTGQKEVPTIALSSKGIDEVIVYLKDVAKGKDWPAKKEYAIDNTKCEFKPHVQAMPLNEELTVVNSDPVLHNTHAYHSASEKGGITVINLALPTEGMKVPKKMTRAGMHRVDCDAHNWMRGWVYVADNPYYAITAKGGQYEIADVPPGNYTVVFWQEALGEQTKQVTVEPGKKATADAVMQGK
jgi:hypothetical protein